MYGKIFAATAALVVTMSSAPSFAETMSQSRFMNPSMGTTTTSARVADMDRRVTRFIERQDMRDQTRLYVSRDNGQRVAITEAGATTRLNR